MKQRKAFVAISLLLGATMVVAGLFPSEPAQAQMDAPRGVCGDGKVPQNEAAIPWVGCFFLSAGHAATGTLLGHQVEVRVDAAGQESVSVDGTVVQRDRSDALKTNLAFVRPTPLGYAICPDANSTYCPSSVEAFRSDPDQSILFTASECFPPPNVICVTNQESWDFQKSRLASTSSPPADLRKNLNVPMPPGPYASWPAESRGPALLTLRFKCTFLAGMAFAGPQLPNISPAERYAVLAAVVSSCVANAMPDDWPQRAAELDRERSNEEKVRSLLPASPDLAAIGKNIADTIKRQAS